MSGSLQRSKTVLVIAYSFPPEAYVGGRRTLKYCKYLGQCGWRPIVVTIKPRADSVIDERLCHELPADVVVQRTPDLDMVWCLERLSAIWHRLRGRRRDPAAAAQPAPSRVAESTTESESFPARVKKGIIRALIASPDPHWPWVFFAFFRAAATLMRHRVDVIYSSSPPHSSHVAAYLLAKCFRKPYVVDFRDPWHVETHRPAGVLASLQTSWKKRIVRGAARVVVVTPGEPLDLLSELPDLSARQVAVITNGYDREDYRASAAAMPDPSRFAITHLGTIYADTGMQVFEAIERLLKERPELARVLTVNLAGDIDASRRPAIAKLESRGVVKVHGFLPQHDAVELARRSDVLLLLQRGGTARSHVPAKFYEYLCLEKPVLAVMGTGTLTELLDRTGLGIAVSPRDIPAIAAALEALLEDIREGRQRFRPNRSFIDTFERKALTRHFAAVLDEAVLLTRN